LITESGDPIQGVLIDRTLSDMGIDPQINKWIHFGKVNVTTDQIRNEFLHNLSSIYED